VLMVTRLDRLARSTRDLLNVLAQVAEKKAGFRSLSAAWADNTTAHGRLMLTVLGASTYLGCGCRKRSGCIYPLGVVQRAEAAISSSFPNSDAG
jgi:Resolvase, N terminal domain